MLNLSQYMVFFITPKNLALLGILSYSDFVLPPSTGRLTPVI